MAFGERLGLRSGPPQMAARSAAGSGWQALLPSWSLVVALLALAMTTTHPLGVLGDPDTYMHIAAGRWMLLHHALPSHDPFSYTMAGAPWVVHEWLSEIVLAAVYKIGGWSGVVLLTGACFAASLALLMRFLLRCAEPFSALIASLLAGELALGHLLARPHMLALPLLVLWCGVLFQSRDDGAAPPLLLLPVMVLWANLHASFMFGLALAGFFGGEAVLSPAPGTSRIGEARRWGLFFLLATLAALCTPNGAAGLIEPFRLAAMPALHQIIEWHSPDFQHFLILEIWLLGFAGLGFLTGIKLPLLRLLLVLALCHMTLQHVRYATLLGFVGPLALAASLGAEIAARMRAVPFSAVGRGIMQLARPSPAPAMALGLVVVLVLSLPLLLSPVHRPNGPVTPKKALAVAAQKGLLTKPVFNNYAFGGYLIFRGVPTFIDGRAELYGNVFLSRYFKIPRGRRQFAGLLDRFHVAWTLLSPREGAALLLDGMPGWRRIYSDRYAVVDVRVGTAPPTPNIAKKF
ncbi:MAG: hypothetical protein ACREE4_13235 [Stellaceae bacterium]